MLCLNLKERLKELMNNNNSIRHILALESGSWKKTFFLDKNNYSIGRNSTNSLVIHHRVISRNHASLVKVNYTNIEEDENNCYSIFWIIDGDLKGNKSTNGIYINGTQSSCHQLQPGDIILLGGIEVKAKYDIVDLKSKTFFSLIYPNKLSLITEKNQNNSENNNSSFVLHTLDNQGLQNFELISEGILVIDLDTQKILAANSFYCKLVNYSLLEIINLTLKDLFVLESEIINYDLEIIKNKNISSNRESIHKTKDDNLIAVLVNYTPINFQDKRCLLVSVQNINEFKKIEEIIRYQSTHDSITNLPNTKLFIEQLSLSLSHNKIKEENLAIMKLRFNNWANLTYKLNLDTENKLINSLVKIIKNNLSAGDAFTKLSPNEYVIMVEEVKNNNRVNTIIENILSSLHPPLIIDEQSFLVTANFGVSIHPYDGENITELLSKSIIALESSYTKSFNSYQSYNQEIENKLNKKNNDLYNIIFRAINEEKLIIKYNPIINAKNHEILGLNSQLFFEDNEESHLKELDILNIALEIGYSKHLIDWWLQKIAKDITLWENSEININQISIKILASYLT
ncbi:diguanylate cyclase domain-containing protein, partial [Geminocystis sp. GBBB08]|uniref:diguanylate cyclase domain-containing protein n=1 Tax=Geminocystis sp. GBBB08 TaxID=2604140 RepID=UPI0027E3B246